MSGEHKSGLQSKDLSLEEFKAILPTLISQDIPVVLASDFDETLCSQYVYDPKAISHKPNILPALIDEANRIQSPVILVTSRSAEEKFFWDEACKLLASKNLPVICENGSVLFFPNSRDREIVILAPADHLAKVNLIKQSTFSENLFGSDVELIIRKNRLATVEFRIQSLETKVGMPEFHERLIKHLINSFDLEDLTIISSRSSLSLQSCQIDKGSGLKKALETLGIERKDIFIVAMGDAPNDAELLKCADLSIAVKKGALANADFVVDSGDLAALEVMKSIK